MDTAKAPKPHDGPLPMTFGFSRTADAVWRKGARSQLAFRDLDLHAGTHGLLTAQHIRATAAGNRTGWYSDDVEFHYVHVMAGMLTLRTTAGETVKLNTGDAVIQPPFLADRDVFEFTEDFEALEFTSQGSFAYIDAFMGRTGLVGAEPEKGSLMVNRDDPTSYIVGDGPRSFFSYRDIGATAVTGRRMHVHIVGIAGQPPGGTGWHNHTMDQFFMPFTGWIELWVENLGFVRMERGDAMFIPAGLRHNVTAFTTDYTVVEVCIPTEYGTASTEPPADLAQPLATAE